MILKSSFALFLLITLGLLSGCSEPTDKPATANSLSMVSGKPVEKGTPLVFPQDHGSHPEQGIEWWYITSNLKADTGETFGVQWTLFRTILPGFEQSKWWDNSFYFAHFAVQHEQQHHAFERFGRAGQTHIQAAPFIAALDDWQLRSKSQSFLPLSLQAEENDYAVNLTLDSSPITLHGEQGYSRKTQSGHASYYFSYPFLDVSGKLTFNGKDYQVTGHAWYDREWSASLLEQEQVGWDWFSIVDDKTGKNGLMLFCIRDAQQGYDYCSGTRIAQDGSATQIPKEDITLTVLERFTIDKRDFPSKWRISIPHSEDIIVDTVTKNALNNLTIPYWEGRITTKGGFKGTGYAELFGY